MLSPLGQTKSLPQFAFICLAYAQWETVSIGFLPSGGERRRVFAGL
jgi:hypothetical protein